MPARRAAPVRRPTWQRSSRPSSMASPTNTSACTFSAAVSRLACASTLPIWVWPPRQSIRSISSASRSACDTQREARHSVKPAIIDELHVEPADRRRFAEHVRLQPTGRVPSRLAAHGGVEREDQPATLAGGDGRARALDLREECIDLGARRVRSRRCRGRLGRRRASVAGGRRPWSRNFAGGQFVAP